VDPFGPAVFDSHLIPKRRCCVNAKFRNISRDSLRPSAREREPVKLTREKITYLVGTDNNDSDVTKKHERETRTAIKGSRSCQSNKKDRNQPGCFPKLAHGP